jgi:MFS family permease
VVSNSGNWLFNVTAAIVVFELSRSALLVGFVSVAQFAPLVFLSPLAGALSDRFDRRRLLLGSQAFSAAAAGALGVAGLLVGVDGFSGPWPIIATAAAIGMGQAFAAPAINALVPALVDDADLESGVALTSLTFNVGRAFGPAASGLLLATTGAEIAFVANAISFVVLVAALVTIQARPRARDGSGDRSVRAGLRYVRADRRVLLLLLGIGGIGFAADPMITLAPPLAGELGGSGTLVSVLVSAFGVAAVPAAAMSGRLQRTVGGLRLATRGAVLLAAGLLLAGVAPVATVAVLGFGLTGIGFVLALTSFTSVLQRRIPDALRGRVMALWGVAFLGNRPIAAAIDGAAADLVGPRWAMAIAITIAMGAALVAVRLTRDDAPPTARP